MTQKEQKERKVLGFKANELRWIFYDIGNSAFILLSVTILPLMFENLTSTAGFSKSDYLAYWGYLTGISTIITAILGPITGALSDRKNRKLFYFIATVSLGVITLMLLPFISGWLFFFILLLVAKVSYSLSLIVNDGMLPDICSNERMDIVSSHGYAWGYIGGGIPFVFVILLITFHSTFHLTSTSALTIGILISALWWFLFSVPLMRNYKQKHFSEERKLSFSIVFKELFGTLKDLKNEPVIKLFLIAFFFYIDGVYTIIDMAVAYGSSLGLDANSLLLALLLTQFVAFPCALIFSKLSQKFPPENLIAISILAYCGIALYSFGLDQTYEFWILAILVGMFQGGIQALSRSYYAKIIPQEKAGAYFGVYDICGKGASFLGAMMVAFVTQLTGRQNLAISFLALFFIIGLFFFFKSVKAQRASQ